MPINFYVLIEELQNLRPPVNKAHDIIFTTKLASYHCSLQSVLLDQHMYLVTTAALIYCYKCYEKSTNKFNVFVLNENYLITFVSPMTRS